MKKHLLQLIAIFCLASLSATHAQELTYKNKYQQDCSEAWGVDYDAKLLQKCEDEKWQKNIARMCEVTPDSNYCREDYWMDPSGPKPKSPKNQDVKKVTPLSAKESKYCANLVSTGKIKRPEFRKCVDEGWEKLKKAGEKK